MVQRRGEACQSVFTAWVVFTPKKSAWQRGLAAVAVLVLVLLLLSSRLLFV